MEDALRLHLEERYGGRVVHLTRLEDGVFRVGRADGPDWVARVFRPDRPVARAEGDADVLRVLEAFDVPAERCLHPSPVSIFSGRPVLLTGFVDGGGVDGSPAALHEVGELLGRVHAVPSPEDLVRREAGSLHHDPDHEGGPGLDLAAAREALAGVTAPATGPFHRQLDSLVDRLANADDAAGLPHALIHPDPVLKNVIASPHDGLVLIDWTAAGHGPRLASLAVLLLAAPFAANGWHPHLIDAVVAGYRRHVRPDNEELSRLAGVMRIRPLWLAARMVRHTIAVGRGPTGTEWWWPDHGLIDHIAGRARAAFENGA